MTMLDRILYALASPLAREIIDSLRNEPGAWEPRKSGQGVVAVLHHKQIGSLYTPESWYWGQTPYMRLSFFWPLSRLAVRRAIRKWEKLHA